MPKGGFRPGAGKTKKPREDKLPTGVVAGAKAENLTPLEYMLKVMNDPTVDPYRRDRMAIAAASYCHPRVTDYKVTKKDREAEAAMTAGQGSEWTADLQFNAAQIGDRFEEVRAQ